MTALTWLVPERSDATVLYQRYYLAGLEETGDLDVSGGPAALRLVPSTAAKAAWLARSSRGRRLLARGGLREDSGLVGRYVTSEGTRFCIDARDSSRMWNEDDLEWSDVYFKANAWPDVDYPEKVRPIVNGNGRLGPRRMAHLRSLRDAPRSVDVVAVLRVWGSPHSVRVLTELARLDCSKDLLAILPAGVTGPAAATLTKRLDAARVPWTTKQLAPRDLWRRIAAGRTVLARPGKHLCWPWRTLDLLCMGACAVYDRSPPPRWPQPLAAGEEYVDCGIAVTEDGSEAGEAEYGKLGAAFERLLGDDSRIGAIGRFASAYFEEHACPAAVGRYLRAEIDP